MKVLVLNGSPRKKGVIVTLLKHLIEPLSTGHKVEWVDVCEAKMKFCKGCMACRERDICILPQDDAHIIGRKINEADVLVIGTPTYWGNMSSPLKLLFDRNVPVFMGESPKGMPVGRQKGKRAAIVTSCTTPWPFNFIFPESRGAIRSIKEVLSYGKYKIAGIIVKPGTKNNSNISPTLIKKTKSVGKKLVNHYV